MQKYLLIFLFLFCEATLAQSTTQWFVPRNIQQAYENGTRARDGSPGINYWQNRADYNIDVEFDPDSRMLYGQETISFHNNSPDNLIDLYLHLYPDLYKKGNNRAIDIDYEDVNDGLILHWIKVDGTGYTTASNGGIEVEQTIAHVALDRAIASGTSVTIEIKWEFELNAGSHQRGGQVDQGSFFLAYFFPRLAVYDDIDGWNEEAYYDGEVEFYNDFGDFEVSIKVPQDYIVWATGLLQNPEEVLEPEYVKRFRQAFESEEVVNIIDRKESGKSGITKPGDNLWKYRAENVSDFAFGISNHFLWQASSLVVDSLNGRRTMIDVAFDKNSRDFYDVLEFSRYSVEQFSHEFPAVPFPFPQQTIFNGLSQMEYPMMANDNSLEELQESFALTVHEIMHAYFPFMLGSNEQKYAWMDEGLTMYTEWITTNRYYQAKKEANEILYKWDNALENMGTDDDGPLMLSAINLKGDIGYYNSYYKSAMFYHLLSDYLGAGQFRHALQQFMKDWEGKHPTGYDFLYSLNTYTYEDIKWLVTPWFFEFGYPDLAVLDVIPQNYGYDIIVGRIGSYPTALDLIVVHEDGSTGYIHHDAGIWRDGDRKLAIVLETDKAIRELKPGKGLIIDVDLSNNTFYLEDN